MNCQFCQQQLTYPQDEYTASDEEGPVIDGYLLFCQPCQTIYRVESGILTATCLLTSINGKGYRFIYRYRENPIDTYDYIWTKEGGVIMIFRHSPTNITPANVNNKIRTYLTFQ